MTDQQTDIRDEVTPYLNRFGPWRWSRAEVNAPMIWNFCEAVEDANPVYWDGETGTASRFGRLIAPPQMIMTMSGGHWWAPDYIRQREHTPLQGADDPPAEVAAVVEAHGFVTATMVTRRDEYLDPFGPGDGRIKQATQVLDVSEPKQTKVGRGVFITSVIEYRVEADDRPVARARNVLLRYDASTPR